MCGRLGRGRGKVLRCCQRAADDHVRVSCLKQSYPQELRHSPCFRQEPNHIKAGVLGDLRKRKKGVACSIRLNSVK